MMAEASLGVAFKAKPKVQQLASTRINQSNLIYILYLLGYSKSEIESLLDF
jgi:phosphoserine phosphatase